MSDPEAPAGGSPDLTPLIDPPVQPVLPAPIAATVPLGPVSSAPPSTAFDRPTFVFFGIVSAVSLILDVVSKAWAEIVLSRRPFDNPSVVLVKDHLTLTIAYNK